MELEVCDSRERLEVGFEEVRLMTLHLPVLYGNIIEERVQFHRLVGCCAILILVHNGTDTHKHTVRYRQQF